MNEIHLHLLSKEERALFFRTAAEIMQMPFEIIEKDYWVVWVLERLFSLEKMKSHLTFKGGTSLSKAYGLIDRFSEDIDLSIEREFFGFKALSDPENAPSKKKQSRVLNAERTFWEKATILHQYAHLPEDKKLPPRISRHFYDFFRLLNSEVKEKALVETALLERVAIHKSIYFASSWANYETARKKTLKLFPPSRILKELEKDYHLMEAMFFREVPDWELILKTIENFEKEFNDVDGVGKGEVESYD